MKQINKNTEPTTFANWKKQNSNCSWSNFSKPDSTHRDIYIQLRQKLIEEQEKMCCYCEVALKEERDAHIEHLKDQDNHPNDRYNFNNLFASCQHNDSCGHKKDNGYFNEMISPIDKKCQEKFTYTGAGSLISQDENDNFAKETIKLLGLNCKRLKDRRKNLIKTLQSANSDYLIQALNSCVDWHDGFYTVIDYMIGKQN
jgi:uncharacterized protein (TIGR02646 family)